MLAIERVQLWSSECSKQAVWLVSNFKDSLSCFVSSGVFGVIGDPNKYTYQLLYLLEFKQQKQQKYITTKGIAKENISPIDFPCPLSNSNIPVPNIPENPVPELKNPTFLLGNPLQNPNTVDSPKAVTSPKKTADSRAKQNDR